MRYQVLLQTRAKTDVGAFFLDAIDPQAFTSAINCKALGILFLKQSGQFSDR